MENNFKFISYIGTYTTGESKGIYKVTVDTKDKKIENAELAAEIENPTYLAISSDNKYLYSVMKKDDMGGVAAYSIDTSTGKLNLINYQLSKGSSPCHVSLDKENKFLFSANYHRGIVEVFPIGENGEIKPNSFVIKHEGSGPNKERQEKAHIHYSSLTPDQKYLCAVDLGIDKVALYAFDNGKLKKEERLSKKLKPGCGPRHMEFHPNEKFAYVITELTSEIITFEYSLKDNTLNEIEYISTLPENYRGESIASAIHISCDGKYLYAGNRGHDSIAIFSIDSVTGRLKLISHISTEGSFPRDFEIAPNGDFILAANQNSSNILIFDRDKNTGKLTKGLNEIFVPNPVCIKFLNYNL